MALGSFPRLWILSMLHSLSSILHSLCLSRAGPGSAGAFVAGGFDGLGGWVAQTAQHAAGAVGTGGAQLVERGAKGLEAEIIGPLRPLRAIQKGGEGNQIRPRLHKVKIQNLPACHRFRIDNCLVVSNCLSGL